MEGSTLGENVAPFSQEVEVLQLVTVEVSGHVDSLGSDDHYLIAGKDQFSHDGGKATQHMAPAINDNCLRRKSRHSETSDYASYRRNFHVV